jgi:hypothetical protein
VNKEKQVLPLENEKISSKSIQSPHDTDCHYRNKDGNKVKGYSANITETCDQPKKNEEDKPILNLITDTQVEVVTTSDCDFLKQALSQSQEILPNNIEKAYTDGAYNNVANQDFCQENNINLMLTALQGPLPRYEVSLDSQDQNRLIVVDNKTGNSIESQQVITRKDPTQKKWRIKTDEGKYRYFDLESLRASILRQKLKDIPIKETNIRCNVEATIFQIGYHYSNDKSNYRNLAKHKLWAYSRSLWINFVRILKYVTQICQRTLVCLQKAKCIINICNILLLNVFIQSIKIITNKYPKYMQFLTC